MKGRAIIPLVIGLCVGVFALKVFVNVLQKARGATVNDTVSVVCAAVDIDPTVEVQEAMLEVRQVPKSLVPERTFADPKELVGRVTSLTVAKGMPVVDHLLAAKGTPPGMAVRIQEGFRAVAVKIDESAGVAGWVKPGSRVDVVVLLSVRRNNQSETISKTILQNVEVLAVGQDIGNKVDTAAALASSVTLLVNPADVPKLHLASSKGNLRLAMRNQTDHGNGQIASTTDNDLLSMGGEQSLARPARPGGLFAGLFARQPKIDLPQTDKDEQAVRPVMAAAPTPKSWNVEVFMGGQASETVTFEDDSRGARRISGKPDKAAAAAAAPARPASPLNAMRTSAEKPAVTIQDPPGRSSAVDKQAEPAGSWRAGQPQAMESE